MATSVLCIVPCKLGSLKTIDLDARRLRFYCTYQYFTVQYILYLTLGLAGDWSKLGSMTLPYTVIMERKLVHHDISSFSGRGREGRSRSFGLEEEELEDMTPDDFHVHTGNDLESFKENLSQIEVWVAPSCNFIVQYCTGTFFFFLFMNSWRLLHLGTMFVFFPTFFKHDSIYILQINALLCKFWV